MIERPLRKDRDKIIYLLWATIRPEMFIATHKEWMEKAHYPTRVRTKVAVNTQEQFDIIYEYAQQCKMSNARWGDNEIEIDILGDNIRGVPYACYCLTSKLDNIYDNDLVIYASDDFYPPNKWDLILYEVYKDFYPGCTIFQDSIQWADLVTLPIMPYSCLCKLNKIIYNPVYHHNYADNELYINLKALGLVQDFRKKSKVVFEHRHFANGKRVQDAVDLYAGAWTDADIKTWEKRKKWNVQKRLEDVNLPYIRTFSILICTLPQRKQYFQRLIDRLSMQIPPALNSEIEIIYDDKVDKTIGAKRNDLLKLSSGKYVAFIDDDDLVSDKYIENMFRAFEYNPDTVGFKLSYIQNGDQASAQQTIHSIKIDGWYDTPDPSNPNKRIYYRTNNHLNPVRKMFAMKTGFPDISFAEDKDYSFRIKQYLKKEIFIESEPMYYYMFRSNKEV